MILTLVQNQIRSRDKVSAWGVSKGVECEGKEEAWKETAPLTYCQPRTDENDILLRMVERYIPWGQDCFFDLGF